MVRTLVPLDCKLIGHAAVDFVQEHVLGQGSQDNESAIEQAKDEQISGKLVRIWGWLFYEVDR